MLNLRRKPVETLTLQISGVFLLICVLVSMQASIDPIIKENIDNFIKETFMPANHNPALTIGITNGNGSLLYSTGYGWMNIEKQLPTTNTTHFLIGSISKSFAALIVAKSLHEKFPELSSAAVNTPIRKLVPNFNFTLNDRYRSEQTTFRDMLSHRVCSKTDGMATLIVPFKNYSEVAYRQRYADEECAFRTGMVYNNGMYALISNAIEAVTGETYENLLLSLLKDLEMDSTTFVKYNDEDEMPDRAIPYYWKDGEVHKYNPKLMKRVAIATAAGGIVSNAIDMMKYMRFYLNNGKVGERQVIPQDVIQWLYETSIAWPFTSTENLKPGRLDIRVGYGMGLFLGILDGWQKIGHGGSVPPFQSHMSFFPALDIGIFSVTNQMPVDLSMYHPQLHNAIFDILQGNSPVAANSTEAKGHQTKNGDKSETATRSLSLDALEDFVGKYGNGLQGELEILLKFRDASNSTELYLNYGEWGQAYLLATETNKKFLFDWDSDLIHDKYAMEGSITDTFAVFDEDITEFQIIDNGSPSDFFIKGVSLDILPPVPWSPGSCGPEKK